MVNWFDYKGRERLSTGYSGKLGGVRWIAMDRLPCGRARRRDKALIPTDLKLSALVIRLGSPLLNGGAILVPGLQTIDTVLHSVSKGLKNKLKSNNGDCMKCVCSRSSTARDCKS